MPRPALNLSSVPPGRLRMPVQVRSISSDWPRTHARSTPDEQTSLKKGLQVEAGNCERRADSIVGGQFAKIVFREVCG